MRDGGSAGYKRIAHFNGGLFQHIDVVPLTRDELRDLAGAASLDWGSVEPAIFGTLFERSLDPSKRAQLGAHYTGRRDIERVVEPVVMAPLRRRWDEVRAEAEPLQAAWERALAAASRKSMQARSAIRQSNRARTAFQAKLIAFLEELADVRILDPACGSGNFLYVALAALLDLEKEVITYGAANGLTVMFPTVRPRNCTGWRSTSYARELAQVVVWIGYLQWMNGNGFKGQPDPVLEPLETIRCKTPCSTSATRSIPRRRTGRRRTSSSATRRSWVGSASGRNLATTTLKRCSRVFDGRVPRDGRSWSATSSRRPGRRSARDEPSGPDCLQPTRFAAVRIGAFWSGSRRPATSSWRGPTSRGCSTARRSAFRLSGSTTGAEPNALPRRAAGRHDQR